MSPTALHVTLSQASYVQGEPVMATLTNTSTTLLRFSDHQTNCTPLTLQVQTADGWASLAPCRRMQATRLLELAPGASLHIDLGSGSAGSTSFWEAGTYRIDLLVFLADASDAQQMATPPFQIIATPA